MTSRATLSSPEAERAAHYRSQGWWPGVRLESVFGELVARDPDQPAVTDDRGQTLSRGQLWARAGVLAEDLAAHGVQPGHSVLIYLPNRVEWQVGLLACLRLRAVPATLPVSTDADTLQYVCTQVGARAVITAQEHRRRPIVDFAIAAAQASPHPVAVGLIDGGGAVGEAGALDWVADSGGTPAPALPGELDHLMFTSSTTGLPKAVMHTIDTLAAVNITFAERYGLDESTPIFMPSPLGHSVGAWHGARLSLFLGAHLVLQDKWDPGAALSAIDRQGCQFTAAATPFLKDILDEPMPAGASKMSSLKAFLCGGAPVPASLVEEAARQAPDTFVTVLWGMTEGGVTTCAPGTGRETVAHSAGYPLPGLELTILPAEGVTGEVGELAMRGPGVFVGYLGQQEMYRELLTEDGYFRTGDLARIDENGYVRLSGRIKDLIIRGGVNISPIPIEDAIAAHPGVRRVAVIGQADDRLGERICAVIVPMGEPLELPSLQQWLLDHGLPTRYLPESLVLVDDVPVTAAGKIRKLDLKRELEAAR